MLKVSRRQMLKYLLVGAAAVGGPISRAEGLTRQWTATGQAVTALAGIDQLLQTYMQARSIPGGAVAITCQGKLVFARGYTWTSDAREVVQPDALFRVASLTKPITSAAIFTLIQGGKLKLSDRLVGLLDLKVAPGRQMDRHLKDVTVLHLLQHLGGWDRSTGADPMFYDNVISQALGVPLPISPSDIVTYMNGQRFQYIPGTRFAYSNYGYCLLGRIIEQLTGQSYEEVVQTAVLNPLGIQEMKLGYSPLSKRQFKEVFYYTRDKELWPSVVEPTKRVPVAYGSFNLENMDSNGRWLASAIDLARFAASFDQPAANPVLAPESIAGIFAAPGIGANPDGAYYACGWQVRPTKESINTWHMGGFPGSTTLMVRRGDGVNWAVLFNQQDDPSGLSYAVIDDQMRKAVAAISAWPDHDLFGEFN